jgi:hypothetical protein
VRGPQASVFVALRLLRAVILTQEHVTHKPTAGHSSCDQKLQIDNF